MPYISKDRREFLEEVLNPLIEDIKERVNPRYTIGEITYIFTKVMLAFLNRQTARYEDYALMIGAMGCAKLELYRRKIAPYEDKKNAENGDVYYETN